MNGSANPSISVIVATYNWPEALNLCLESLAIQTDRDFEIVIADDGSGSETAELVERFKSASPLDVSHVWQEDAGFRKTLALNKAINAARGSYLVFLDGDCIVQPDFVARHRGLSKPGHMVTGSRILLGTALTEELCVSGDWNWRRFLARAPVYRLSGQSNKLVSLFLKLPDMSWRDYRDFAWRRIKGCNMACWKADAEAIGGFDETITGWGHEDADFVFRLHEAGIVRKSGAFATEVLHLWHREIERGSAERNADALRARIGKTLSAGA